MIVDADATIQMLVNFKKIDGQAKVPTHGSDHAAGLDLYARIDSGEAKIPAGETVKVRTGIAMEIPYGYFGAVYARSGLATKHGLRPANAVGIIDADYRGEIIVALHNDSKGCEVVHDGDRIAQIVIMPYMKAYLCEVPALNETIRGEGGFGSTGVN